MNGRRLDIASGANHFDRQLGNFRVQILPDDEGSPQAKLTAKILAPRHLSEPQRSSGIPSTVDISTPPIPDALKLAVDILRAAKGAGIPLPQGVVLRWSLPPDDGS